MSTADIARAYNDLAIQMPDGAWSKKFAHSRMEVFGDTIYMQYCRWADTLHDFVPDIRLQLNAESARKELTLLKARQARYLNKVGKHEGSG